MSPDVFLASCDPENFDRTVRSPVDLSEQPDRPDALAELDAARLWGVGGGSGNETTFEKLESGDLVLFYQGDEYVGTGRVGVTVADDAGWANAELWDDDPAEHLYTVEAFTPVSVPKAAVNRIFDYSDAYNPQGSLMRVAPDRVERRPAVIERAIEKYDDERD